MEERLLSEKQFMEVLELQQKDMEAMRRAGLPYVRAGRGRRLYVLSAIMDWAKKNLISAKDME